MAIPEINVMERDNLFASQVMPVVSDLMTVAQTGALKRGSVLTVGGTLAGAEDEVYAVLAEDVDTTAEAVEAAVYLTGEFNISALAVAEGAVVEDLKASARKVGIFFKKAI